jgi:uncharacterized protein (DUF58 family)
VNETPERLLNRLDWHVIRRLDGVFQGDYRTLFHGEGLDLADLREYQPPDDIRRIDWNVTARMDRPYVREYVEDREVTAWMLLDRSASMSLGTVTRTKHQVLAELVVTLGRLLTRRGNRVGAIIYDTGVAATIEPRSGRNQVLRLANSLMQPPSRMGAATDLAGLIHAGLNTIKRRSLVFIISDFISRPGWERPLPLLAVRNELVAVRIWDPREKELPDAGVIVIEDSETGEQLVVDTGDPRLRHRFTALAQTREEHFRTSVARAGVDLFELSTTENLVTGLIRMAEARRHRGRR